MKILPRVLSWVSKNYFPQFEAETARVLTSYNDLLRTRGTITAVKLWKLNRLALERFLSGNPLPRGSGVRLDRYGLPLLLGSPLRKGVLSLDPRAIRASMTVLSLSRKELGGSPIDFSPIVDPSYAHSNTIDSITDFAREYFAYINYRPYSIPDPSLTVEDYLKGLTRAQWLEESVPFHYTTKSGPNGPALQTALGDYLLLTPEMKSNMAVLEPRLKAIFDTLDHPDMDIPNYQDWFKQVIKLKDNYQPKLRKLSLRKDKETKSRLFAIMDYWTQSSLKGIHDHLFKVLKSLPPDCSFDQLSGRSLATVPGLKVSADLTAATDRFPISLQENVLAIMTNSAFSSAWKSLLVDHPFHFAGNTYMYGAGQPMGAHSSWPMFTLCHHIVVQYAAKRTLGRWATELDYRLLGDDIVLVGDAFSSEYMTVMGELGVEINLQKTHSSERMFEFAKRLIVNGIEMSAYPLDGLIASSKYYLLAGFLVEQADRAYPIPTLKGPYSISSFLQLTIGSHKSRLVKSLVVKVFDFIHMSRLITEHVDKVEQYACLVKWASIQPLVTIPYRKMLPDIVKPITSWLSARLYQAYGDMIKIEDRRIAVHYALWRKALMLVEGKSGGLSSNDALAYGPLSLSSGTGSFSLFGVVPVLGSVAQRAYESTVIASDLPRLKRTDDVYQHLHKMKMVMLPDLAGVNPLRKTDIVLGTRSVFSKQVAKTMASYQTKYL